MSRQYHNFTPEEITRINTEYQSIPYGKKEEYAKKVAEEMKCSAWTVKKIGVRDLGVPVDSTVQGEATA